MHYLYVIVWPMRRKRAVKLELDCSPNRQPFAEKEQMMAVRSCSYCEDAIGSSVPLSQPLHLAPPRFELRSVLRFRLACSSSSFSNLVRLVAFCLASCRKLESSEVSERQRVGKEGRADTLLHMQRPRRYYSNRSESLLKSLANSLCAPLWSIR